MGAILRFDLGRHLSAISTWVYFAVLGALAYFFMAASTGAFEGVSISFGGGKVLSNSPFALTGMISLLSYFGLLIISAIMGKAAFQDFEAHTHSFFFTSPISKASYLGGRFLAAMMVLVVIFSGVALGLWLVTIMPFIDKARIGQNHLWWYVQPYLVMVIPNIAITGALFFSLAALTRRILPVYMASVILLVGYLIATTLGAKIEEKLLAALLDPFGQIAMDRVTEYWTIAEKNTRIVGLAGALLWNRLLWAGMAAALMAFTYVRFKFVYALEGRKQKKEAQIEETASAAVAAPAIEPVFSTAGNIQAFGRLTWLGFTETVKNIYFAVIVLAGILFMIAAARTTGDIFGTPTYPVTYEMIDLLGGSFSLFVLIVITFYSGELVWRERDAGTHELMDALPLPTWVPFLSKFGALFLVQVVLAAVAMFTGMAVQLAKGYTHLEPLLYLKDLFGLRLFEYCLICVLAISVQTLLNNKYMGHFVMVLYYLFITFGNQFGLSHNLYRYGENPGYTYSDMNGFGPFLGAVLWFDAYWAAFAVLLALVSYLYWVRGLAVERNWRNRLAGRRFGSAQKGIVVGAGAAFAALGGFIFYNTNILNTYRTEKASERLRVRFEKEYKHYRNSPQPRITDVRFTADIYPDRRTAWIKGHYELANRNAQPVQTILVSLPEIVSGRKLHFTPEAELVDDERLLNLAIYKLKQPLAPGATGSLDFEIGYEPHGFSNSPALTSVVANGTFFNSDAFPHFGYQESEELPEDNTRRKYGLLPKQRMPDLNDMASRQNNYLSSDSDWVTFDAVVSTSPDQIAIAPGELVRDWNDNGRRYFEYRTRGKVLDFFSVLSARYRVMRDHWNDVDLGIYYTPGHEYNLADMMKGMKLALDYCTRNFSPYQNKTVRIVEFPRYAGFAQSFPASIPYSESIGFIARVDRSSDEDVDYPLYVTAHEVAHQWWAHQVIGGNVQGATMLSESLAQYTALMVMKHEVGAEQMRKFLKYEMDRYLIGRATERKKELPLERVENQQYIHYQKGSIVFYALQDYVGEEKVNQVLHDYVQAVAFQAPPYTNAAELVERFRKIVPPEYAYLIHDMFETIILYENRALSATYRQTPEGKYEVKLKVSSKKLRAGELGEETDVPLADWIDIGVLDAKGNPLYLAKHKIDHGECEFTVVVDQVPAKAGIDPLNKLVDRLPDDNTIGVTKL
jgi:ABC-2 type transport system permease protein